MTSEAIDEALISASDPVRWKVRRHERLAQEVKHLLRLSLIAMYKLVLLHTSTSNSVTESQIDHSISAFFSRLRTTTSCTDERTALVAVESVAQQP